MSESRAIALTVNGAKIRREVEVCMNLVDFLREELRLTGSHVGCEHGVCGACTVLVDGRSVRGCLMLAVQVDDTAVSTVEGLALGDNLHPLQQAFWDLHGLQCGFCTPGILMTLVELLQQEVSPDEAMIRDALGGHLCRCTGYQNIVAAALAAVPSLRLAAE